MNFLNTIANRLMLVLALNSTGCCTMPNEAYEARSHSTSTYSNVGIQKEYIGIIHCHSKFSHDSTGTREEISKAAKNCSLDFVIMSEHLSSPEQGIFTQNEGLRGVINDVLFIHGFEISKSGGSILAVNPNKCIDKKEKTAQQIIDDIHNKNGMAFISHVESFDFKDEKIDGFELYNAHAIFEEETVKTILRLIESYMTCSSDSRFHPLVKILDKNITKWDSLLAQGKRVSAFAGNDVHVQWYYPWEYADFFKLVRMHVFANELNTSEILTSIVNGKCYISFDSLADGTGFDYFLQNKQTKAVQGQEIKLEETMLHVQLPAKALIKVMRNGKLEFETKSSEAVIKINKTGAYRIEAYLGELPWIISNPIYVIEKSN